MAPPPSPSAVSAAEATLIGPKDSPSPVSMTVRVGSVGGDGVAGGAGGGDGGGDVGGGGDGGGGIGGGGDGAGRMMTSVTIWSGVKASARGSGGFAPARAPASRLAAGAAVPSIILKWTCMGTATGGAGGGAGVSGGGGDGEGATAGGALSPYFSKTHGGHISYRSKGSFTWQTLQVVPLTQPRPPPAQPGWS